MDSREIFDIVSGVAVATIVMNVAFGIIRWSKLAQIQKLVVYLASAALLTEITSRILRYWSEPTYPGFHIYALIEYSLLALMFSRIFQSKRLGKLVKLSIGPVLLYGLLNSLLWQPLSEPNTNFVTASGLIMIGLSLTFFSTTLNEMRHKSIEQSAHFWISIGVAVYFASTILMFFTLNWLADVELVTKVHVLVLNALFNVMHYICFTIALWMKPE